MITLEAIAQDVGLKQFSTWRDRANRKLKGSQYRFKDSDAQHAFIYEEIIREYHKYQNKPMVLLSESPK